MTAALLAPRVTHPGTGVRPPQTPARPTTDRTPDRTTAHPDRTARSTAGTARTTSGKRALAHLTRWTVRLMMLAAIAVFAGLALGPHVLGYRTMTMLTASMAPDINPGDVVVVTPLPISEVQAGMVISYHIPIDDHRLVSHRVLSVETAPDGAVTVQTKGDANDAPDPWQATLQGDTAWQVTAVIPELGNLIQALRTPIVSQALVYGAPALLAGWLLLTIWTPTRTEDQP
ncbi:signal peptidase I [Modestobacter lapidis]